MSVWPTSVGAGLGALVAVSTADVNDIGARRWWPFVVAVLVGGLVAAALVAARRHGPPGWTVVQLLVWLGVIYLCVPETDQIPPLAGGLIALALGEVITRRCSPLVVHALAATLVLWAGMYGATGRGSALVGAMFGAWIIVLAPLTLGAMVSARQAGLVSVVAAIAAAVMARVGGLGPSTARAVVVAAGAAAASWVLAVAGVRSARRASRPRLP